MTDSSCTWKYSEICRVIQCNTMTVSSPLVHIAVKYNAVQSNTKLGFDDRLKSTRSHNYSHDLSTSFPALGNKEDDPPTLRCLTKI